jgi:hypothetical protein
LAENERQIREINEDVELLALDAATHRRRVDETEVEFFCACGRADCSSTILLTIAEYAAVHEQAHRFIVVPGHETPQVERVVEEHRSYNVVEKLPEFREPEAH